MSDHVFMVPIFGGACVPSCGGSVSATIEYQCAKRNTRLHPHLTSSSAISPQLVAFGVGLVAAQGTSFGAERRLRKRGSAAVVSDAGIVPAPAVTYPEAVAGYACRPVVVEMPEIGNIWALVVDDEGGDISREEQELPDWVPKEWLNPVMGDSDVNDVYGAIGVWPASFTAAELLHRWVLQHQPTTQPWRCIEIGSGAGFPSLVAARLGATVLAVDLEPLPLALLEAAFTAQRQSGCIPDAAVLETHCGRAEELSLEGADVIVVSDLLYSVELGRLMGQLLACAVRDGKCRLLLTDGIRSGSAAFLETFEATLGSPASFEEFQVPTWAPNKEDLFDGKECTSVRILHY